MEEPTVYDLAILGAGVSGLTLAWLLSADGAGPAANLSILLVDGARDDDELRTLSFWSAGPTPLEPLVRHRWCTLRLHVDGADHDVPLRELTYCSLFFADLQREVKQRLAARPGDRVVEGRAQRVEQDGAGAVVTVGAEQFRARWVLDSRFHLRDLVVDQRRHHYLRQHFHGWVVRAPRDVFDPAVATLLDFGITDVPAGTGFVYVLPFSPRVGLVELVTLQPVDAEPVLRRYLADRFDLPDVELLDRESGISPMTEQPFGWRDGPRVRRIGVAAGRLKPSTGYALTRILDDAQAIVRSLERDGHPFARPPARRGYRLLDAVLLELWQTRPELIPPVFGALFLGTPADVVLRFLDERAGPAEVLRIVRSLPPTPFLRAAARWSARRAGAALVPSRRHSSRRR